MTASLPTPLGPLMTMTRGLGFGEKGSELKEEPREASRARRSSERSALSTVGMGTDKGLRASPIEERSLAVVWKERLWVVELRMGREKE